MREKTTARETTSLISVKKIFFLNKRLDRVIKIKNMKENKIDARENNASNIAIGSSHFAQTTRKVTTVPPIPITVKER